MKNIYRLALTGIGHHEYHGQERFSEFVISAESKEEAREIASQEDDIGKDIWKDERATTCHKMNLERKVISSTFLKPSYFK